MARVRTHSCNARIECGGAAAQRVKRKSRCDVGSIHGDFRFAQRDRREREHRLRAVEQREAFFRFEYQRRDSCGTHGLRAGHCVVLEVRAALADRNLRQMRQRREITRCADGALRWNHRMNAAI